MDIHGENSFKSKSYASAAFAIEKLQVPLQELTVEKISALKGIGSSSAQKIEELLKTGKLKILEDLIQKTPPGVLEMLNIKGIGPKKINSIWKEMEIESVGELLYACKENRLKLYKGFGEKTQQNIIDTIEFYNKHKGSYLYAQVALIAPEVESFFVKIFPGKQVALTGLFKRQFEVVNELELLVEADAATIESTLSVTEGFTLKERGEGFIMYDTITGIPVKIYPSGNKPFTQSLIRTSSSEPFYEEWQSTIKEPLTGAKDEWEYFEAAGISFIPAPLRETPELIELARKGPLPGHHPLPQQLE